LRYGLLLILFGFLPLIEWDWGLRSGMSCGAGESVGVSCVVLRALSIAIISFIGWTKPGSRFWLPLTRPSGNYQIGQYCASTRGCECLCYEDSSRCLCFDEERLTFHGGIKGPVGPEHGVSVSPVFILASNNSHSLKFSIKGAQA